jgi:hypothetical protein
MRKPIGIVFLGIAVVGASVAIPITVRNWPNLMDMRVSGEDRVKRAFDLSEEHVKSLCQGAALEYPPKRIFLRAFKLERELEVWGSNSATGQFTKIQTYRIAGQSGRLGPKRREGDLQDRTSLTGSTPRADSDFRSDSIIQIQAIKNGPTRTDPGATYSSTVTVAASDALP